MKVEVFITVEKVEDVEVIAKDLHEILCDNGITNSINITDEISE
ncbi:hypothetical protein J2Z28_001932 [Paenibacillus xylanexedens]|uniref:Uncharacterized protein n=1 Tax=Paenibacillus xylanexedens TaxID=528191 RepID=A0ABS4RRG2_PAEXY|nr:hypothetical protein [Paenibacillus xylanexedens]